MANDENIQCFGVSILPTFYEQVFVQKWKLFSAYKLCLFFFGERILVKKAAC